MQELQIQVFIVIAYFAVMGYAQHYGNGAGFDHGHGHYDYHHEPAHYAFEYKVHDPHTHDIKAQHESREGDAVRGFYSLVEPDGSLREVHYTAGKHTGFNAHVVHKPGHGGHH